jgi:hypothetical protein
MARSVARELALRVVRFPSYARWRLSGPRRTIAPDVIALHEQRALYFAVPKVANSSIKAVCAELLKSQLGEFYDPESPVRVFRTPRARRYLIENEILIPQCDWWKYSNYLWFSFVRNPYDRLVSCFADKVRANPEYKERGFENGVARPLNKLGGFKAGMTFSDFVHRIIELPDERTDRHLCSQSALLSDPAGRVVTPCVGKYERLQDDFSDIFCRKLGLPHLSIPHMLASKRGPWESYYDDELRRLVYLRYQADFHNFGYDA